VAPDAIQSLRNLPARPVAYHLPRQVLIGGIIVLLLVIAGLYLFVAKGGRDARVSPGENVSPVDPVTPDSPPVTPSADAVTIANRGLARLRAGGAEGASEEFTKAIRLAPGSAQLFAFRAQAYGRSGKYDLSIADWTRFIELMPSSHEGYSARGQQYLRSDNYQQALSDFEQVIALDSDSWLGYELMGDTARLMGNHADTIRYYKEALLHEPPDPAARYFYMSKAATELGDSALAERYMSKATSTDAHVAKRLSSR
jgi:tetratricopeptide (TPR) repeat protein